MKPLLMAIVVGLVATGQASAQVAREVHFARGNFGTMVEGQIRGRDYVDYRLGAKAGQELFAELSVARTDGDGTIYFNILPPGSETPIYLGSMDDDNSALVGLPRSGSYTIRVYLMGNDADAGKSVAFNLDLSIQ